MKLCTCKAPAYLVYHWHGIEQQYCVNTHQVLPECITRVQIVFNIDETEHAQNYDLLKRMGVIVSEEDISVEDLSARQQFEVAQIKAQGGLQ